MEKSSTGKRVGDDKIIKTFFESYDYHKDPEYMDWEEQLYDEDNKFTFEKTLEFCKLPCGLCTNQIKKKWLEHIQQWNMIRYEREVIDHNENSIIGYAAVTYLYIVFPYELLERNGERSRQITEFQAKIINICMLHETGENLLYFKDYDMLTIADPPYHPSDFEYFLDEQYNSASWFLTFLVFLNNKEMNLDHKGALWT